MEPSEEAEGSNDEDIYNDLPDFSYGGKIDELQKSNEALRSQLFLLESKLKELKTANSTLTKRDRALSRNISVLFATTSAEIEYKNRIIQDLRKERDSLIFRRVRHSTTYETQTTYIPPASDLNCVPKEREHSESVIVPVQTETIAKPVVTDTSVCSPSNNKHPKRGEQSLKDVSNDNVTHPKSSKGLPKISKQKKEGCRMDKNNAENNIVKDVSKKTVESTTKPQQASNQKKSGVTQVETAVSEAPTSVTEDVPQSEASSSTPKLQSESILRDLLKKGLKMSPFKIDYQTGFKIPKVSGQVTQVGTSNVLKDTEVLSKSYEQQSITVDVSVKSESSVDISVPSVTDCTGGKRCRTFIRSISISENESSSSSSSESKSGASDSDEKQDSASPQKYSSRVSPKRKIVSSPKMESRNYVPKNNKHKSSDQRIVDYKSIEKIRIVNGAPKKMVQSPVKCRLKVTAVLEEPARPKHSRGQQPISTKRREKSSSSNNRQTRDISYEQEPNHNKRCHQEYTRHSPSPPRRPSPTIKKYSTSHNRRSPSTSQSHSPSPRRQITSHRKHSPSSSRSRSPPLSRRRSRSPRRHSPHPQSRSPSSRGHSPSHRRSHSPSPIRRRSPTPVGYNPSATRRHSLTPRKRSSSTPRSLPRRKQSLSPERLNTSPPRRHSTSPIRQNSSSPPRKRSQSPIRRPSSSRDSPSPILRLSPSPMKHHSPSPPRRHSPPPRSKHVPPPKRRSPSLPPRRHSQSPSSRRRSPSPLPPRRRSPSPPPPRRCSPSPPPRRHSPSPPRKYSPSPRRQHKDKGRRREDVYLPHSPPRKSHRDLRNYIRMKKVEYKKASKRTRPPSPEYSHHKRRRLQEPERRGPHPKKIAHYERHFLHKVEERAERKSPTRRHEEVQKRSQNGHHHSEDKHRRSRSPVVYQNSHHRNEHDYKSDENARLYHTKEKENHTNIKGSVKSRIRIIRASISSDGEEADSPVNRKEKSVNRHRSPDNEIPKIPAGNKRSRIKTQILDRESSDCSSDAEEANRNSTRQTVIPYKSQTTRSPSHSLEEGEISDSS